MTKNYSWIRTYYRQFLSTFIFAFVVASTLFSQSVVNGNLGTSATSNNGTAAPAGTIWHELQHDVPGQSNNSLAIAHAGAFSVADDFVIPAGQTWSISTLRVYSIDQVTTGTTSPYTGIRVRIWSGTPGAGGTIVYGDLTTNRFAATAYTARRGIFNSQGTTTAPTPNLPIFQIDATINTVLPSGTYWVEWQVTTAATFAPTSQTVGIRSLPTFNARQNNNGVWAQIVDLGSPATAPDVPVALPFTLNYVVAAPCVGAPTPGNTVTSNAAVCPLQPFTLSIQNNPPSSGITYQYQSGPTATGPFTNIAGATSSTYSTTLTANTYYQVVVSCGTESATSTPVLVSLNAPSACYCTAGATNTGFEKISNVTFGTINNNSTSTAGYENFLALSTNLTPGLPTPISVSISGAFAADQVIVWIDYNQNGSFTDPGETVYTSATGVGPHTGNIIVPFTALSGTTRMRVRMHDTSGGANATSCGTSTFGQVEDYTVNIQPVVPCTGTPAPGNTISTRATACAGTSFTLSLQNFTSGSGVTYQWQSSATLAGTYTNIAGATNVIYTTTLPGATTFYRAIVTCGANAGTSTPVMVTLPPFTQCYCVPTPATNCSLDDRIANVTFGSSLNNNSGCTTGGYTNYTTTVDTTDIVAGGANPISVTVGPGGTEFVGVWIDYNKNGVFESSEYTLLGSGNGVTISGVINVPANAPLGVTGMRVRVRFNTTLTGADACLSYGFGETEDYLVNITACIPGAITSQPVNRSIGCSGSTTFSTVATGSLLTYLWEYRVNATSPWLLVPNAAPYSGLGTNTLSLVNASQSLSGYQYRVLVSGACTAPFFSNEATLTVTPLVATTNVPSANLCVGTIQALTVTNVLPAAPTTVTFNGATNIAIPDAAPVGVLTPVTVTGIPAGATISEVKVTLNIAHTYVGDLEINLIAPNNGNLNLIGELDGGTGSNSSNDFVNTVISSLGTTALSGAPAPRTGTFKADALAGYGPQGNVQTVTTFAGLTSVPNGTWRLGLSDWFTGDAGVLNSWSLSITYFIGSTATGVFTSTTAPGTIFTDALGTVPYVAGTPITTVYVNPTATTNYSLVVTTPNCVSAAVNIPVTVSYPVNITLDARDSVCAGNTEVLRIDSTGNVQNVRFQVSTDGGVTFTNIANGGIYSGATTSSLSIINAPISANGYVYRAIASNACNTDTSNNTILTVNPLPTITVSASPSAAIVPGMTATLSAAVSPNAAATYQWFFNGVLIPGATASSYVADVDGFGNYTVRVTDINGCTTTSAAFEVSAGTSENLFIYPSPNTGQFQIRYNDPIGFNSTTSRIVNIYDSKGSRVYTRVYPINQPFERLDVDLRHHGKGIYTVDLTDRQGRRLKTGRVVIF